ncbi:MAG: 50S ribosomal protein L30 [bacterium]
MAKFLKVELLHGAIARDQRQKDTLRGLGLRRRHQQRVLQDTPAIRGMIRKVFDLVKFEPSESGTLKKPEAPVTYKLGPKPDASQRKVSKTQARKAAKAAKAASGEGQEKKPAAKAKSAKAAPAAKAKKASPKKSKG